MDMEKEFGATGEALYRTWERKYEEIVQHVKFGGADAETAFETLKKEINDTINEYNEKAESKKKFGIVTIPVALIALSICMGLGDVGAWVAIIGILLPVYGFMSRRGCRKVAYAAFEFDKKYFGGEIFYRRKNG